MSASTVDKVHTVVQIAIFSLRELFESIISVGILFVDAWVDIVNSLR
ncbi:hypothetical protein ACFLY2_02165 [Patescibacteria group bacterium]